MVYYSDNGIVCTLDQLLYLVRVKRKPSTASIEPRARARSPLTQRSTALSLRLSARPVTKCCTLSNRQIWSDRVSSHIFRKKAIQKWVFPGPHSSRAILVVYRLRFTSSKTNTRLDLALGRGTTKGQEKIRDHCEHTTLGPLALGTSLARRLAANYHANDQSARIQSTARPLATRGTGRTA